MDFRGAHPFFASMELDAEAPNGISQHGGMMVFSGAQTTRTGVLNEVDGKAAVGSLYLSSAGKLYLKVAKTQANTDWARVTTSAAD